MQAVGNDELNILEVCLFMIGSIIGDIVGSIYEFDNIKTKDFPMFQERMEYTDDSILTLATADWLMHGGDVAKYYLRYATDNPYPMGSYGTMFVRWIHLAGRGIMQPYGSCGNGSAMRIGPVGWAFLTEEETLSAAKISAECTHNHPEGIEGAQSVALCIYLARMGYDKAKIADEISRRFSYDLSMPVDELRMRYSWHGIDGKGNGGICRDSVPQAIICALQADGFEDAIRNAVSIGGDSDTIACIAGSIAEALYGVAQTVYDAGMSYLPQHFRELITLFEDRFGNRILQG